MGIKDLHKLLESVTEKGVRLSRYRGKTVAVDASSWLHKGAYGCAWELVTGRPTDKYVRYVLSKVDALRHFGIEPLLVFDGASLPLKRETNHARGASRDEHKQRGMDFERQARCAQSEEERQALWSRAHEAYQRAVRITFGMAEKVSRALERHSPRPVQFVVAPFEADAQIARLCGAQVQPPSPSDSGGRTKGTNSDIQRLASGRVVGRSAAPKRARAEAAMSEDSDLLVYSVASGAHFPVLFKTDFERGTCDEVQMDEMARLAKRVPPASSGPGSGSIKFVRAFGSKGFDAHMFVQMCCLSGCDYTPRIEGVGLLTAQKLLLRYRSVPADKRVGRVLYHLRNFGAAINPSSKTKARAKRQSRSQDSQSQSQDAQSQSQSQGNHSGATGAGKAIESGHDLRVARAIMVFYHHLVYEKINSSSGRVSFLSPLSAEQLMCMLPDPDADGTSDTSDSNAASTSADGVVDTGADTALREALRCRGLAAFESDLGLPDFDAEEADTEPDSDTGADDSLCTIDVVSVESDGESSGSKNANQATGAPDHTAAVEPQDDVEEIAELDDQLKVIDAKVEGDGDDVEDVDELHSNSNNDSECSSFSDSDFDSAPKRASRLRPQHQRQKQKRKCKRAVDTTRKRKGKNVLNAKSVPDPNQQAEIKQESTLMAAFQRGAVTRARPHARRVAPRAGNHSNQEKPSPSQSLSQSQTQIKRCEQLLLRRLQVLPLAEREGLAIGFDTLCRALRAGRDCRLGRLLAPVLGNALTDKDAYLVSRARLDPRTGRATVKQGHGVVSHAKWQVASTPGNPFSISTTHTSHGAERKSNHSAITNLAPSGKAPVMPSRKQCMKRASAEVERAVLGGDGACDRAPDSCSYADGFNPGPTPSTDQLNLASSSSGLPASGVIIPTPPGVVAPTPSGGVAPIPPEGVAPTPAEGAARTPAMVSANAQEVSMASKEELQAFAPSMSGTAAMTVSSTGEFALLNADEANAECGTSSEGAAVIRNPFCRSVGTTAPHGGSRTPAMASLRGGNPAISGVHLVDTGASAKAVEGSTISPDDATSERVGGHATMLDNASSDQLLEAVVGGTERDWERECTGRGGTANNCGGTQWQHKVQSSRTYSGEAPAPQGLLMRYAKKRTHDDVWSKDQRERQREIDGWREPRSQPKRAGSSFSKKQKKQGGLHCFGFG